jgi:hypothetical protein
MAITLGSLAVEINAMLGNRSDVMTYSAFPTVGNLQDSDRMALWIREAYNEITYNYRFEELEQGVTGMCIAGIDFYKYPPLMRRIRAVTILFPLSAGQQEPRPVRRRHIRNIRRYQTSNQGPPSIYAPYNPGTGAGIILRPVPDQGYPLIWDIVLKPTYNTTPNVSVANTVWQLSDDWLDIFKWLVALKGHTALVEPDKAAPIQQLLFGGLDPRTGRKMPGIIKERTAARDQLDIEDVEFGLQPQVRRYTNTV